MKKLFVFSAAATLVALSSVLVGAKYSASAQELR